MIAPIRTQAASGKSSHVSAKPPPFFEARRGAEAVDFCVVVGAGVLDEDVGVVAVAGGVVAVVGGAVAVVGVAVAPGVRGNCCVSAGGGCPRVAPPAVEVTAVAPNAITPSAAPTRTRRFTRVQLHGCALTESDRHTCPPHTQTKPFG